MNDEKRIKMVNAQQGREANRLELSMFDYLFNESHICKLIWHPERNGTSTSVHTSQSMCNVHACVVGDGWRVQAETRD